MKEKDLEKCLDNLIIKGLIQEAEQDNADFEVAMRKVSDEDFLALIYETVEEPIIKGLHLKRSPVLSSKAHSEKLSEVAFSVSDGFEDNSYVEWDKCDAPTQLNQSKAMNSANKGWKVWAAAIASVAAMLLIVFVPAHMDMNSRLCESALLASEAYTGPTRGFDIASMSKDDVKAMLPELERQYAVSKHSDKDISLEQAQDKDTEYYIEYTRQQEAGLDLVQAYLKLSEKDKAVKVLKELAGSDVDQEFIDYCQKMIEILE